jgi:hypothetical protein
MILIQSQIKKSQYAHLDPIIDVLISNGNSIVPGNKRWNKTKDGWLCVLSKPIDFSLVTSGFVLPPNVKCYPNRGSISCGTTWAAIVESR